MATEHQISFAIGATFDGHLEYTPDHGGSFVINKPQVLVDRAFTVSINRGVGQVFAAVTSTITKYIIRFMSEGKKGKFIIRCQGLVVEKC